GRHIFPPSVFPPIQRCEKPPRRRGRRGSVVSCFFRPLLLTSATFASLRLHILSIAGKGWRERDVTNAQRLRSPRTRVDECCSLRESTEDYGPSEVNETHR